MSVGVRLLTALLLACLAGCAPEPARDAAPGPVPSGAFPPAADSFETLLGRLAIPNLTVHRVPVGTDTEAVLVELVSAHWQPVLVAEPGTGVSARTALQSFGLTVLVGSGFVAEAHSLVPVGLLLHDNEVLSPLEPYGYTRILGFNDKELGVVHRNQYHRDLFTSALQVGPGIIEHGMLDISERDLQRPKYYRSFVALCESRWIAGATLGPTNLYTLGSALHESFAASDWRCQEVVNLAGDRQAVLMITDGSQAVYHGDPNTHKVSLIGFLPR